MGKFTTSSSVETSSVFIIHYNDCYRHCVCSDWFHYLIPMAVVMIYLTVLQINLTLKRIVEHEMEQCPINRASKYMIRIKILKNLDFFLNLKFVFKLKVFF